MSTLAEHLHKRITANVAIITKSLSLTQPFACHSVRAEPCTSAEPFNAAKSHAAALTTTAP